MFCTLTQRTGGADLPLHGLTPGVGARTVAALAFVAEVLHGAPSRFADPARFSFAHGGKDGHPFPVPLKVYDATTQVLRRSINRAHLDADASLAAIRRLGHQARWLESSIDGPSLQTIVAAERDDSAAFGGRTVAGKSP